MSFVERACFGLNSRGLHRLVYSDWGDVNAYPIIGVHGLTGNGHDFDFLAPALVEHGYRVIAIDLPGRGRSDFLSDPLDYNYTQYCNDITTIMAHAGITPETGCDWIGISLGGLLGIRFAGMERSPIRRLILNDVGPTVPKAALDLIYMVIAQTYRFDTVMALEQRMKETRGLSWGPVTDEQWTHMAAHNARATEDGMVTYSYDPAIAAVFKTAPTGDVDLWPFWDSIQVPVLVIQGGKSMILPKDLIEEMRQHLTKFDLQVFEDCGHVPSLWAPNQIDVITHWLKQAS